MKARVDLGDQTAEFIPFEVIRTAILTYFYLLLGINLRILVSVINTPFQMDASGCLDLRAISQTLPGMSLVRLLHWIGSVTPKFKG